MVHSERLVDYGIEGRQALEREGQALLDRMAFGAPVFNVGGHEDILAGLPSARHLLILVKGAREREGRDPLSLLLELRERLPPDSELFMALRPVNFVNISPITNYPTPAWAIRLHAPLTRFRENTNLGLYALEDPVEDKLPRRVLRLPVQSLVERVQNLALSPLAQGAARGFVRVANSLATGASEGMEFLVRNMRDPVDFRPPSNLPGPVARLAHSDEERAYTRWMKRLTGMPGRMAAHTLPHQLFSPGELYDLAHGLFMPCDSNALAERQAEFLFVNAPTLRISPGCTFESLQQQGRSVQYQVARG